MKIRTQLIAGTIIFALLLVIISGLIFSTNQQLDRMMDQEDLANRITLEVSELGYLSNDYILYHEPLQAERWNAKFSSVSADIAQLDLSRPDQQAIASSLTTGLRNTKSVFDDISSSPLQTGAEREAFLSLSWSRMAVQNQGMIFDANRLASLIRDDMIGLRGVRLLFIIALMGAFGAFLLASYFLFYRRTLKSIADLQEGARIIGAGNLGYVLVQRSDDEIGELSGTINRMTGELRTVIASKSDLEHEVTARKKAEEDLRLANEKLQSANNELIRSHEELSRKNTDLSALNEELTATHEELRQNIDELGRAEQELRKSRERYRNLFETMTEGFAVHEIVCDAAGTPVDYRFLNINPAFERLTGLKRCEVIGKLVSEILPGMEAVWIQRYGAVALTGIPDHFDSYSAVLDRHYEVVAYSPASRQFAVIFNDVTESRAAGEALRQSERRLRSFYQSGLIGVIYWDMEGRITDANDRFLTMTGYTREDLDSGRIDWLSMTPPEFRYLDEASQKELATTGVNARPFEKEYLKKDGSRIPVMVAGAMLDDTRFTGVAIVLDISERKRTENELKRKHEDLNAAYEEISAIHEELQQNVEQLTKREAQLQDALSEKEALLSEIHHRVKNNLAAFISLLSLDGSYEDTRAGRALQKDLQNRARSMALIHETLYRTGKFSTVDMDTYLTTLVAQISASYAGNAGISTEVEARGVILDLSRATTAGLIVNELVTNSYKYAFPPGFDSRAARGEPCRIRVALSAEDGTHVLVVSDNGQGLPAGFDPLTAKSLGLKLVNFLGRHQLRADISVRGERGTEFIFRLQNRQAGPEQ